MTGYIRYRNKKLKDGGVLAFRYTTKMDSAMNQIAILSNI